MYELIHYRYIGSRIKYKIILSRQLNLFTGRSQLDSWLEENKHEVEIVSSQKLTEEEYKEWAKNKRMKG